MILITSTWWFTACNQKEVFEKQAEFTLPESVNHHEPGWIKFLSPKQMVDSIKAGVSLNIYYISGDLVQDSGDALSVPTMKAIGLGMLVYEVAGKDPEIPLLLICTYGDDSKRLAEMVKVDGFNSYILDGGTYRFMEEFPDHEWIKRL